MADDAEFGRLVADFLSRSQLAAPRDLPHMIDRVARGMGLGGATVFLADVRQQRLVPLPDPATWHPGVRADAGALEVEGTLAGWAYRTLSLRVTTGPDLVLWLPLVDGVERIGVLRVTAEAVSAADVARCRALATLVALVLVSKSAVSDALAAMVRSRPMSLQAELVWAFMPPRTIGTRDVTSTAVLEPAYEVGGDAFDHSLAGGRLHMAVVDAMGHDLASGGTCAVALAGFRAARRSGAGLVDMVRVVDRTLARWIPDRLLTTVLADLDTTTGAVAWVNCGHPPPLLIRRQKVVPGAFERVPDVPLGLGGLGHDGGPTVHRTQLEPGDRLLIHTDGVTEARSGVGRQFGEQRLIDTIVRATAAGEPAPEALRRLVHAVVEHQDYRLHDDATILLAEWHPDRSAPDGDDPRHPVA
jgi:hypothetical protein